MDAQISPRRGFSSRSHVEGHDRELTLEERSLRIVEDGEGLLLLVRPGIGDRTLDVGHQVVDAGLLPRHVQDDRWVDVGVRGVDPGTHVVGPVDVLDDREFGFDRRVLPRVRVGVAHKAPAEACGLLQVPDQRGPERVGHSRDVGSDDCGLERFSEGGPVVVLGEDVEGAGHEGSVRVVESGDRLRLPVLAGIGRRPVYEGDEGGGVRDIRRRRSEDGDAGGGSGGWRCRVHCRLGTLDAAGGEDHHDEEGGDDEELTDGHEWWFCLEGKRVVQCGKVLCLLLQSEDPYITFFVGDRMFKSKYDE